MRWDVIPLGIRGEAREVRRSGRAGWREGPYRLESALFNYWERDGLDRGQIKVCSYLHAQLREYLKSRHYSAKFTFKNPNIKDACGCGESFTVG